MSEITFKGAGKAPEQLTIDGWVELKVVSDDLRAYIDCWVKTHPCKHPHRPFVASVGTCQVAHELSLECLACGAKHAAFDDEVFGFAKNPKLEWSAKVVRERATL